MSMSICTQMLPRSTRVKNKTPSPIQITAEQIVRESRERSESEIRPPKQQITASAELLDYRLCERRGFEELIRRVGSDVSIWVRYAQWEGSQKDFNRSRSVWERALAVDYRSPILWLKYAEMEIRNKFLNHARNIFNRALTLLPRVDQLWYKYIHMERMLGNVAGTRQIFERWMEWHPDQGGWLSYIKFEVQHNEIARAREIYERFLQCHPRVCTWIQYLKFELKMGEVARARDCYQRAVDFLGDDDEAEQLSVAFPELCKESEVEILPYPDDVKRRRFQYEGEVLKDAFNYDLWFDYIRLEQSVGIKENIRTLYRRAIKNIPLVDDKSYWQRYIYLWINYALYEELEAHDEHHAREVYRDCLKVIPHEKFSFAKVWGLAAHFEIRNLNLKGARKILGNALGKAPKGKIFKLYIEIELQLGNVDRCRKLYEKYLEWSPDSCYVWTRYAEMEISLCETDRARAIFELAIAQSALDMPEVLWKAYIDFETTEGGLERTRQLYERLLSRTKHVKVWVRYAKFEASAMEDEVEDEDQEALVEHKKSCIERARGVFELALNYLQKEERVLLLGEWVNMEKGCGDLGDINIALSKMPEKLKRKRVDNVQILQKALEWKKQRLAAEETITS